MAHFNETNDTREALSGDKGIHIRESVVINVAPETVYKVWRQLEQLPSVMPYLDKVEQLDAKRSRWTAKAFDAVPVTWEAEIINEVPFQTIGWQTLPDQPVVSAGSVKFKPLPGGGGTEVRVNLQYAPPGGRATGWLAALVGQDPAKMTREALLALKRRLETH
jgi:uncharacterized membrane protein